MCMCICIWKWINRKLYVCVMRAKGSVYEEK